MALKIVLCGYGKMGKEIEKIALGRGHSIVLKIDKDNAENVKATDLQGADVVIEFSTPHTVLENIRMCFDAKVPVVVGTTGWYEHFESIRQDCSRLDGGLFHATNFSLGVNLFFKLNTYLARLMNHFPEYEIEMEEIHHVHKLDKPSGTAISLAGQILAEVNRKKTWTLDANADKASIRIEDKREGEVPGTHIIKYTSAIDDIEIMHKAHNRQGFALGAVLAAEFMAGKTGIHTMNDLLKM